MRKLILLILIHLVASNISLGQLPLAKNGKLLEINNAQIYYEEYGSGEPLFLLHGFLGTTESWKGFIEEYSSKYRVIVWDMRGHGRSTNPDAGVDFKHEQAARDLLALMDKLKINKAKAIGHSSGGITILYAATIAPERFDAIVPVAAQLYYSKPVRDWIKSKIWEQYYTVAELDSLHGRNKSETLKKQFYNFWEFYGDPAFTVDRLQKITARTLIVHGDDDFVPVSQAWEMYQNIPNARLWISPNTGHMPQLGANNVSDFITRTMDFLDGRKW